MWIYVRRQITHLDTYIVKSAFCRKEFKGGRGVMISVKNDTECLIYDMIVYTFLKRGRCGIHSYKV